MTATRQRPRGDERAHETRDPPGPEGDAAEEEDPLQRPHGAEEHGAGDPDDAECGRGRSRGAHPGRLPARDEVVPARGPRRERGQLADEGEGPEEQIAGPDGDHHQRDDHGKRPLAPGAERVGPHPAPEAVSPRSPAQVVELVEVRVLAEGRPDAPGEERDLGPLAPALRPLTRAGRRVGRGETLVREAAEVARQPCAAPHLETPHLGVGEQAVFGQLIRKREISPRRRAFHRHAPVTARTRSRSRANTATTTSPKANSAACGSTRRRVNGV